MYPVAIIKYFLKHSYTAWTSQSCEIYVYSSLGSLSVTEFCIPFLCSYILLLFSVQLQSWEWPELFSRSVTEPVFQKNWTVFQPWSLGNAFFLSMPMLYFHLVLPSVCYLVLNSLLPVSFDICLNCKYFFFFFCYGNFSWECSEYSLLS